MTEIIEISVVQLDAMWNEERLETDGFSGGAGYVVITQ